MPELTNQKHEFFAREYVLTLNATDAYQAISPKVTRETCKVNGCKLLTNANIKARVDELKLKRADKLEYGAEELINDYKRLCKYKLSQLYEEASDNGNFGDFGVKRKRLDSIPDDIPIGVRTVVKGDRLITEYILPDRLKAMEQLGRHFALFSDKLTVEQAEPVQIRVNGTTKAVLGVNQGRGDNSTNNNSLGQITNSNGNGRPSRIPG